MRGARCAVESVHLTLVQRAEEGATIEGPMADERAVYPTIAGTPCSGLQSTEFTGILFIKLKDF